MTSSDHNILEMERCHVVKGLDPIADFFDVVAGGVTVAVNMQDYDKVLFYVYWGVGATGTATLIVQSCATQAGGTPTGIAYYYRTSDVTTDVAGTITLATSAGVTTTAGSSQVVEIEANAADVYGAAVGNKYCRLLMTEVVDSPVIGAVLIKQVHARYRGAAAPRTALT